MYARLAPPPTGPLQRTPSLAVYHTETSSVGPLKVLRPSCSSIVAWRTTSGANTGGNRAHPSPTDRSPRTRSAPQEHHTLMKWLRVPVFSHSQTQIQVLNSHLPSQCVHGMYAHRGQGLFRQVVENLPDFVIWGWYEWRNMNGKGGAQCRSPTRYA